jgi:DNA mismatch repair protein MutL
MADIIRLLPDNIANQIAAGEVIQRPASVVKELVENAIDAEATQISVVIIDFGRTLIQVIDNGKGMSETDARMAFERHATSKISSADDLFSIHTMGFRGEALASIASVAEVVLQTRRDSDEVGVEIDIKASEIISQEYVSCPKGANFSVKNLFFNLPARRKFLKSDAYELRLISFEVQKIALAFPEIEIRLVHNDNELLHYYPVSNLRQRIINVIGKNAASNLIEIKSETLLGNIFGYVGKAEAARKSQSDQFFFVNRRYMRHSFFHKAIVQAYEKILTPGLQPPYFIYFEMDPQKIDVNIHPTKTEIKFEDEQPLWQIINAAVRESLGKFNIIPSIDFDTEPSIQIPVASKNSPVKIPAINLDPNYNPFALEQQHSSFHSSANTNILSRKNLPYWETLLSGFENEKAGNEKPSTLFNSDETTESAVEKKLLQIKGRYILTPSKSGFMLIDQKRAHERILFDQYLNSFNSDKFITQQSLFPQIIELSANDYLLIQSYLEAIERAGFDIRCLDDYKIEIAGCPSFLNNMDVTPVINQIVENLHTMDSLDNSVKNIEERLAEVFSKASSIPYGKILTEIEMENLIDRLFACSNHHYAPDGKPIIVLFTLDEIEKKFG